MIGAEDWIFRLHPLRVSRLLLLRYWEVAVQGYSEFMPRGLGSKTGRLWCVIQGAFCILRYVAAVSDQMPLGQ
jgi:hypothetical protein